jgi:4-hydroxybenzoate polyprenyltransferase
MRTRAARHEVPLDPPVVATELPLCVDLDETFLKSDVLIEGLLTLVKKNPLALFAILYWLAHGKARLKAEVAARADLDVACLPVNEELLDWLMTERMRGRRLVLCTAADGRIARRVAEHYGIFHDIVSSDESRNLSGEAKAAELERRYGSRLFDYAGNELKDRHVWERARAAIVVDPTPALRKRLAEVPNVERTFDRHRSPTRWLDAIRLHQWAKNVLILIPAIAAHSLFEVPVLVQSILAVWWFCLCASGTYIVNDLLDLDADRKHPRKRNRPFARGDLPLQRGLGVAGLLVAGSIVGGVLTLGLLYAATLVVYLVGTLWYSAALKRIAMMDVLALAGLYTVRVLAGAAAVAIVPSFWMLAFSMFMFLNLAIVKRYVELRGVLSSGESVAAGRGYTTADLPLLLSCGTSAGFVSVLVLALYVNSSLDAFYSKPELLWLLCPLLLYWICRVWRKTFRGSLHEDPVVFALTDKPSLVVGALSGLLFWIAI